MIGLYLAACKANHEKHLIMYQDIDGTRNYGGDMLKYITEGNAYAFDYIIMTPPCNFYSFAKGRKWRHSMYSLETMHLLPACLKLAGQLEIHTPILIENVRNEKMFEAMGINDIAEHYGFDKHIVGRHTIWTKWTDCSFENVEQVKEFKYGGYKAKENKDKYREGGSNVYNIVERFIETVTEEKLKYGKNN